MTAQRLAWCLTALSTVFAVSQLILIVTAWSHADAGSLSPRDVAVMQTVNGITYALVGMVIVTKRRGNLVGWLLLVSGVIGLGWGLAEEYALRGLIVEPGSLRNAGVAALLSERLWVIQAGCVIIALLVFPTGRLLSRAWWTAAIAAAAAMTLVVPSLAALWHLRDSGRSLIGDGRTLGITSTAAFIDLILLCLGVSLLGAVVSIVVRWRRSRGVERLQLKWLMFAAAVTLTATILDTIDARARLLFPVAILSIPAAIGIAVLRYHLYEIERIISRTVTYAIVFTLVISVYATIVVLPSVVFDVESDLFVAAATLVAVGAFGPVRTHLTAALGRRFNRARYDATTTADEFLARLRHQVDIDDLAADMLRVVEVTVQPTQVRLLVRGSGGMTPLLRASTDAQAKAQHARSS